MKTVCVDHVAGDLYSLYIPGKDKCVFSKCDDKLLELLQRFDTLVCYDYLKLFSEFPGKFQDIKILYDLAGEKNENLHELVKKQHFENDSHSHLSKRLSAQLKSFQLTKIDTEKFDWRVLFDSDLLHDYYTQRSKLIIDLFNKFDCQEISKFYNETFFKFCGILYEISNQDIQLSSGSTLKLRFNPSSSKDGRLSCRKNSFNVYSLPKKDRGMIVARPDHKIVQCDFKSFQARLAIFSTDDDAFKERYRDVIDIYSKGSSPNREENKLNFFRMMYGVDTKDSELMPIFNMRKQLYHRMVQHKKIVTPFGRVLWFNDEDENVVLRNYITLLEADLVYKTIVELDKCLKEFKSHILFPFHDAIVFEIHKEEEFLLYDIQQIMENAGLSVFGSKTPIKIQYGENFGDLKDLPQQGGVQNS